MCEIVRARSRERGTGSSALPAGCGSGREGLAGTHRCLTSAARRRRRHLDRLRKTRSPGEAGAIDRQAGELVHQRMSRGSTPRFRRGGAPARRAGRPSVGVSAWTSSRTSRARSTT